MSTPVTTLHLVGSDVKVTSINYGQTVMDTVTVPLLSPDSLSPTGTVTFWYSTNGGSTWNKLGDPVQLQNGMASSEPMTPIAGDYLFNATYSGDSNYASQSGYWEAEPLCVNPVHACVETTLLLVQDQLMDLR